MSDSQRKAMADLALFEAQAAFGINLLREVSATSNASLILSPISIAVALSMAYAGADGHTRTEFDRVFAQGKSNEQLNQFFHQTLTDLAAPKNVTLETANRAYFDQSFQLLQTYKDTLTKYYKGEFEEVNFSGDKEPVVEKINTFVENATHDKIKNLIKPEVITSDTRLILVNAIYFKGNWLEKFPESRTADQSFYVSANSEKQVKMMKMKTDAARYLETDELQVLELPYADESTTFVAILPKERFGLSKVLESMSGKKLLELKKDLRKQEVNIELPRFKITKDFGLSDVLSKLGFSSGFTDSANFSGISQEPICITDVIHKAFIEVNELGAEAAAATGLAFSVESMPANPPPVFRADQPFLFGIFSDDQSIFLGQYDGSD